MHGVDDGLENARSRPKSTLQRPLIGLLITQVLARNRSNSEAKHDAEPRPMNDR